MVLNHGSLFSGIGGFDLAAEWMGWNNVFHCEWNEFGQKILKHYWPNAISYGDITKTDFTIHRGNIDILTGGFPCQPYSMAGKRKGKEDERHLWPEMLRAIREIQPIYIVGENVPGLLNWNGGLVFNEVQVDLENEGYEVQPVILPACGKNAPHRRERVWFVAYSKSDRNRGGLCRLEETNDSKRKSEKHGENNVQFRNNGEKWDVTNSRLQRQTKRQEQPMGIDELCEERTFTNSNASGEWWNKWKSESKGNLWEQFPTQSPICSGDDGLPSKLDGITFPKWKSESVKAYGNAIVPQVAHEIFKAISKAGSARQKKQ